MKTSNTTKIHDFMIWIMAWILMAVLFLLLVEMWIWIHPEVTVERFHF